MNKETEAGGVSGPSLLLVLSSIVYHHLLSIASPLLTLSWGGGGNGVLNSEYYFSGVTDRRIPQAYVQLNEKCRVLLKRAERPIMANFVVTAIFSFSFVGGLVAIFLASKLVVAIWDDQMTSKKLRAPMKARSFRRRH